MSEMHPDQSTRRSFLRAAAVAAAAPAVSTTPLGENVFALSRAEADEPAAKAAGPNDRVRIATVGMGIIGFIDTDTALKVPGVELVAAADLYEGRRVHAKEVYGDHVQTYVDYREILARKDVDAVLVCVPDFWHTRIAIDAMKAGKAVYCEKPMVRAVEEGPQIIAAQAETKAVFQVGSQTASSIVYDKVKELLKAGAIGPVNMIEARYNRNSSFGAWQYSIPTDASPQTVDWDRFLGSVAPRLPFDAVRFFRWRNYSDYGTAVAGDLFVHLLTGIHHATGALGPNRVSAMGGRRYWDDGRDVYDVILALLDYPDTSDHKGFTLSLQTNFEDGGGGNTLFRFVGPEGVINVSFTELTVDGPGIVKPTAEQVLKGYNSVRTFSNAQQKTFAEQFLSKQPVDKPTGPKTPYRFVAPKGYDERYDHFVNFFKAVRGEKPVYEDATFGLRAAAPALLCNESYRQGRVLGWDPVALKMTS